jgi:hypothetical protein
MTFVDHLKGTRPESLYLEVAFGRHMIAGDLAKSIVTGVSPTHIVTVQQLLGDAFGKGWNGPEGCWFSGTNRPAAKYKFYPGIMSPGNADATQGIDATFDQDTPHSNTAWIRCEAPSGSEVGIPAFDTKNTPPTGFSGIFQCQKMDLYNSVGSVTATNQYTTNPADIIAFGCKEIRRYANSRIDWASLDVVRQACNVTETPDYTTLPKGVGLTGSYYEGTTFSTLKSKRVDPVVQYDLSSGAPALDLTATSFSVRWEGKIKAKYSETYTFTLIHNDSGKLVINGTTVINQAATGTHTGTFAMTADTYYDVTIEWTNAAGDSQFTFQWNSASQTLQTVPQDRLYPKAEAVKRFECHARFTAPTTFDDFLRQVLFSCNGGYQDTGGQLKFFIIDDVSSSFTFTEQRIVRNSFKFYPRFTQQELMSLPNRYVAEGRDLHSRYLEAFDPPLYYDIADLQDLAGRVIETTVNVGNTYRWQGLKNLAHYAKLKTQNWVSEFEGQPQTLPVLPGDKTLVTHTLPNWNAKEFLVIEATDKSMDSGADTRIFKLLEW